MASPPGSPIIRKVIELAKTQLDDYQRKLKAHIKFEASMGMGAKSNATVEKPKLRAFHMTGPHVLNFAIQVSAFVMHMPTFLHR